MVARRDERITRLALGSANRGGRLKSGDDAPQLVETIGIDTIDPDPDQPRRHFDEAKLAELADSLATVGQLQPIIVIRNGARHTLLIGERRWRAAQRAGHATIRAIVRATPLEAKTALVEQLVENEQRDDLSVSELILSVARLSTLGLKNVEIARALAKSPSRISELQALAEAPAPLSAILDAIGLGLGYQLLRAWRAHAQPTLDFIAHMPVEHISRVTIATIGEPSADGTSQLLHDGGDAVVEEAAAPTIRLPRVAIERAGEGASPRDPAARPARATRPSPEAASNARSPSTVGALLVEHGDQGSGEIMFGVITAIDHLAVRFADGRLLTLPKDELRFVRTIAAHDQEP